MHQISLATGLRVIDMGRDEGAGGTAAHAIAQSFAATMKAKAALVMVHGRSGKAEVLGAWGLPARAALLPDPPFMLASAPDHRSALQPEWRRGSGHIWLCTTVKLPDGDGWLSFNARYDADLGADAERTLAIMGPSLNAFASAMSLERGATKRIASYESALDRSELGIILLGCEGALVFANRVAEKLLAQGDCLRRKGAGISARDLGDSIKLQVAIDHVCSREDGLIEDPVLAIPRRHPLRPLLVCVSPTAVDGETDCDAGAVLRIIDPDRDLQSVLLPVCAQYHLSPVETRLACEITRGSTLEAAAGALRIKPQTARSYLKQIFLKTDTNRQSELIRLLLNSRVRATPAGHFRVV